MSRCAPIVATKVSGNVDLITNGVTGLLVPPKDPETLANKILYFIDNPDYGCTLGENARKVVLEKYTWDIVSKRFQDVYQN
jgi:glycosyltransferase involved in cell wall biosynthesis